MLFGEILLFILGCCCCCSCYLKRSRNSFQGKPRPNGGMALKWRVAGSSFSYLLRGFYMGCNQRNPSILMNFCKMSGISAEAQSVLDFWFEPGKELQDHFAVWFGGKSQDEIIKSKFSDLIEKARTGQLKPWEEDPKSALAHIILIDQFCRNVHRGSPKSFDCDHVSLAIAKKLVENGRYKELNPMERFFSNLPFEHSENMDDQDTALKLYKELAADTKGTKYEGLGTSGVSYSQKHREVIEKFGRFPKRNAVLGRTNTPEEEEILKNYPYNF